jgi:hypothetical protein
MKTQKIKPVEKEFIAYFLKEMLFGVDKNKRKENTNSILECLSTGGDNDMCNLYFNDCEDSYEACRIRSDYNIFAAGYRSGYCAGEDKACDPFAPRHGW